MCSSSSPVATGAAEPAATGSAGWNRPRRAGTAAAACSSWSAPCPAPEPMPDRILSHKAGSFTESVIREMTRLNLAMNGPERAINFAQGFPDFPPSEEIVRAAHQALEDGYHQ